MLQGDRGIGLHFVEGIVIIDHGVDVEIGNIVILEEKLILEV